MKFNSLIPELSVTNFDKSIYFYVVILGFKIEYKRDENNFAFLSLGDAQLMIEQTNEYWKTGALEHPYGRGINFQFKVKKITEIMNRLEKENCTIFVQPEENWYRVNNVLYGFKEFLVLDPDGYLLRFSEELGTKETPIDKTVCKTN